MPAPKKTSKKKKPLRGRPPLATDQKRTQITVRLPQWVIRHLRDNGYIVSREIERCVCEVHNLEVPA